VITHSPQIQTYIVEPDVKTLSVYCGKSDADLVIRVPKQSM
jgi:hypothetical protein